MQLKIGGLAKRAGLTVRTLHHYDAIGLLSPSDRSERGYRLYNRSDVARLHQIQAIKQLGFPLSDVREMLSGDKVSAPEWKTLFRSTYGNGDPELVEKVTAALAQEPEWRASKGVDAALLAFLFPDESNSNHKNFQRAKVKK